MKGLKDFSIRLKIGLLLGIPLVGLLGFGGHAVWSAWAEAQAQEDRANRLKDLVQLSTKTGALVHSLQKERGLSAGYLSSDGADFGQALERQQRSSDQRLKELREFLEDFEARRYGQQLAEGLEEARSQLQGLDQQRQKVRDLRTDSAETIDWYTQRNSHLLNLVASGLEIPREGAVTRQITAYYNFLQGKERAGIERAILASAFAQDAFENGQFREFASLVAQQRVFFQSFRSLATSEAESAYEAIQAGSAVRTTQRMRQTAFERAGVGGFGIDPEAWFEAQTEKIEGLKEVEDRLAQDLIQQMGATSGAAQARAWAYLGIGLLLVLATLGAGYVLIRALVKPLEEMVGVVAQVAANDLTVHCPADREDEIGQLGRGVNHLVDQMRQEIEASHARSSQVASASQELSATSDQIGSSARESSQKVDQVSQSANEVNNVVQDVANNISEVSESASNSTNTTKEGMRAVEKASERIQKLRESGERVDDIMETIQAIAKKTDLLALNAAIEAANAGEQGKGFAVVADEVRKLAEQTSEATGQVSEVVGEVREHSDSSVTAMGEVQENMRNVLETIEQTDQAANQIASAAEELAATMSETTANMEEINRNVGQVAEGVDQIEGAVRELEQLAGGLQESLGKFKIEVGEHTAPEIVAPPASVQNQSANYDPSQPIAGVTG